MDWYVQKPADRNLRSFYDSSYPDSLQDQTSQRQLEDPSRSDQAQQALDDELVGINTQSPTREPQLNFNNQHFVPSAYGIDPTFSASYEPIPMRALSDIPPRPQDLQSYYEGIAQEVKPTQPPSHHRPNIHKRASAMNRAVSSNLIASDLAQPRSHIVCSPQVNPGVLIKSGKNASRYAPPWKPFNTRDVSVGMSADSGNSLWQRSSPFRTEGELLFEGQRSTKGKRLLGQTLDPAGVENDNMSASSSYRNSVLSIQSLALSASTFSGGSGYSAGQIATATRELVLIFQEDEFLVPLYKTAVESSRIGPERLQRNLHRLFKEYAKNLGGEAINKRQYLASRLVSIKAKYLAESIIEKFQGVAALKSVQNDSSEIEEEDKGSVQDGNFEDLVVFREFLVASDAFGIFRIQVQRFVLHPTFRLFKPEETVYRRVPSETPLMDKEDQVQNNCGGRLNMLWRTVGQLLIAAGQLEPPLQQGRSRLRWKCKCGKRFFGDVTELQENGIAKLISRMENSSNVKVLTSSSNPGVQRYSFQSPVWWLQAAIGKIISSLGTKLDTSTLPQHNGSTITTTCPTPSGTPAQQHTLHLMACMNTGRHRKGLYQDRVETIKNDRKLFTFLGEQYIRHRGRFKNIVSLKNIQGIFFVKFRLPMGSSVEIRHHDPCCVNAANTPCSCIPPPPKVEPSPSAEYRCIPGPPETYPPVMSEQLIHMFNSPSCIDDTETWILDLLPKRICGELRGKAGQPTEGWGIYYKEGWDRDMIAFMIFAVFLLGSLLFGVLWSKFQMDIQGAFGVSAYMGTACGIFVAIIAMRAER